MPDIYVTVDSALIAPFFSQINNNGLIYDFAVEYIDANRKKLEAYGSARNYVDRFQVDDGIYQQLLDYVSGTGMSVPDDINAYSKRLIINRLKAFIGRDVYDDAAFYPVFLEEDKTFLKALEI
jgi:carboxyl-terminal processing protease